MESPCCMVYFKECGVKKKKKCIPSTNNQDFKGNPIQSWGKDEVVQEKRCDPDHFLLPIFTDPLFFQEK